MGGAGTFTPQCLASFMCAVIAARLGKLCLHHTHLRTSFAWSAPLFSQWDCHALCLPLVFPPFPGTPLFTDGLNMSSPPSLLNSLIFSSALVASLGVGTPPKWEACFSCILILPFHSGVSPIPWFALVELFFGDRLAATAAAKYGKCDATTGDVHGDTTDGLNSEDKRLFLRDGA